MEFAFDGQTYHLLLNAAALFDLYERFGDNGDLLDQMVGANRAAFDNTCYILVKLVQQGEAYRRFMQQEPAPMLTLAQVQRSFSPRDILRAQDAIRRAFSAGFARDTEDAEQDVDLGLLELQKKTAPACGRGGGWPKRRWFWG